MSWCLADVATVYGPEILAGMDHSLPMSEGVMEIYPDENPAGYPEVISPGFRSPMLPPQGSNPGPVRPYTQPRGTMPPGAIPPASGPASQPASAQAIPSWMGPRSTPPGQPGLRPASMEPAVEVRPVDYRQMQGPPQENTLEHIPTGSPNQPLMPVSR